MTLSKPERHLLEHRGHGTNLSRGGGHDRGQAATEVLLVTAVEEAMVVEILDKMNLCVMAVTGIVACL